MIKEIIYHVEWLIIFSAIVVGTIFTNYRFEDVEQQINCLYIHHAESLQQPCHVIIDIIDVEE